MQFVLLFWSVDKVSNTPKPEIDYIVNSVWYFYFFSTYFKVFTVTPTLTHEKTVFSVARLECLKGFPIVDSHQVSLYFLRHFLAKSTKVTLSLYTGQHKNKKKIVNFILFVQNTYGKKYVIKNSSNLSISGRRVTFE